MSETTVTFSDRPLFMRGDRIAINGRRAVVKEADLPHTLTIAYRDAWYWRAAWKLEDLARATARRFRPTPSTEPRL